MLRVFMVSFHIARLSMKLEELFYDNDSNHNNDMIIKITSMIIPILLITMFTITVYIITIIKQDGTYVLLLPIIDHNMGFTLEGSLSYKEDSSSYEEGSSSYKESFLPFQEEDSSAKNSNSNSNLNSKKDQNQFLLLHGHDISEGVLNHTLSKYSGISRILN